MRGSMTAVLLHADDPLRSVVAIYQVSVNANQGETMSVAGGVSEM